MLLSGNSAQWSLSAFNQQLRNVVFSFNDRAVPISNGFTVRASAANVYAAPPCQRVRAPHAGGKEVSQVTASKVAAEK